jgi:hypothetical protein
MDAEMRSIPSNRNPIFYLVRSIYRYLKPLINRLHIRSAFLNIPESRNLQISYTTPLHKLKPFLLLFRPSETEHELARIGGNKDGGYLVPKSELMDIDACFSIGCNLIWDFEREIGEDYGIPSIIVDDLSQKPSNLGSLQTYVPSWLGKSSTGTTISLEDLVLKSQYPKSDKLLLQMDIEGAEFECLIHTPTYVLKQFRILVIEFHNLENILHHHLFKNYYHSLMTKILADFEVVHSHPNNDHGTWQYKDFEFPKIIEVTFLRRDRIKSIQGYSTLPHKLDHLNSQTTAPILINWGNLL